ncbi:vesicle transport protein USE1 isoform X2 [Cimex lectularius]|uniref:Vesicle transport protein USE1 n=1 Tax=Cimex lectularius TaxID=79782 RepID=A0A8I6S8I9_CIMLE|nr:vesicle transport protein USE1 isoform X2 [Cimex lectularius]
MCSRDEINLKRLLQKCEQMARNVKCEDDWRFRSYVTALVDMAANLKSKSPSHQKSLFDETNQYQQRIDFLKGLLNVYRAETPLAKSLAMQVASKGNSFKESHEIYHALNEDVGEKVREELFENTPRRRKLLLSDSEDSIIKEDDPNELDELLKHHHNMQEKIAENMLSLAKNIKEQSIMAGKILKNDSENVEKSLNLANKNITDLKVHSDNLHENTRSSWHCWSWILLVVVTIMFINTVLLMKMLKKSNRNE